MFELYSFNFQKTVAAQINARLEGMASHPLSVELLRDLRSFQSEHRHCQGVYLLLHKDIPVYAGKAVSLAARLEQHRRKLSARKNIQMQEVRFKCLILDESMSTAANETLLIRHFISAGQCAWNKSGFGSKDTGKERDSTKTNQFDRDYPINGAVNIDGIDDDMLAKAALERVKEILPFRYQAKAVDPALRLNLRGVSREAIPLLKAIRESLGAEWKGTVLSGGILLYKRDKNYELGTSF